MTSRAPRTRALLACGALAGPVYATVTLLQALTRDGFDLRRHRFSWLTAGDLGWIHQTNMIAVGLLTLAFAVGARRVMRAGAGATWAPRLLGAFGAAYLFGGLLAADPVAGFPPGTPADAVRTTWQGALQNASRGVSTLLLLATAVASARWFAATRGRGAAWLHAVAIPAVFAALTAVGTVIGGNPAALAFLMTPWIWVAGLAIHLSSLETGRSELPSAGAARGGPVASRSG